MTNILVADDSLTIQKIVKITLEQHFDLKFVSNQNDLLKLVETKQFPIVLLDYSLSPDMDGFELCFKIKEFNPSSKVLLLFGTFDTIDQQKIVEYGIEGHLIKPFDGKDLIDYCLLFAKDENLSEKSHLEMGEEIKEEDDMWVVASTGEEDYQDDEKEISSGDEKEIDQPVNQLEKEMQNWGVDIPPKIKDLNLKKDLVQEEVKINISPISSIGEEEDQTYPNDADLEYPDIEFSQNQPVVEVPNLNSTEIDLEPLTVEEEKRKETIDFNDEAYKLSSELISENDLNLLEEKIPDSEEGNFEDTATFSFVPDGELLSGSDHSGELLKQIDEENESDEFWVSKAPSPDLAEMEIPKNTPLKSPVDKKTLETPDVDYTKLYPVVEEMVEKYCKETVEKMIWKIVPELAEKIIQSELEKLAEESKEDH